MEQELLKIFNKIGGILSTISVVFSSIFNIEWILFLGYLILNFFDYLTGTIKSKVTKIENSTKGAIGILKKICYWILLGITFFISFLLAQMGEKINVNLEFVMFFGWFTLASLIINESRSIIENLIEIGIDVPSFLKKGLEIYNNKIEKVVDTIIEEKDEIKK